MNPLLEMLTASWIVMGFIKVAAVAVIAGVVLGGMRQQRLSSSLWAAFMILLPLVFFSGLSPFSWRILPTTPQPKPQPRFMVAERPAAIVDAPGKPQVSPDGPGPEILQAVEFEDQAGILEMQEAELLSSKQWLLIIWVTGALASLVPALLSLLAARRLPQGQAPAEIRDLWKKLAGTRPAEVPVHLSSNVAGPGVSGLFRPIVVLPSSASEWSEERLECVLRHELQHLANHDLALRWLGRIARSLLWFHPAAWWGQHRLELAQERAADEAVVVGGVCATAYAEHLLAMASQASCFPGIAMAKQSQVGGRIRLLLAKRGPMGRMRKKLERFAAIASGIAVTAISLLGVSHPSRANAGELRQIEITDKGFRPPIVDRNDLLIATSDPLRMPEELRAHPPVRWYPEGAMLGHLTGYIFKDKAGEIRIPEGMGLESDGSLRPGKPLRSSIDLRIQRLVWDALEKRGLPGSVVVMDPRNGEVLAMASWPSYDPNFLVRNTSPDDLDILLNDPRKLLLNRAVLPEAPGSMAKVLTALAAAKADKIDRVIHCGPSITIGNFELRDWDQNRNEDLGLVGAMRTSCNTYFVPLAMELGPEAIKQIGADFGFDRKSTSPWPGRPNWYGFERNRKEVEYKAFDLALASIGQGPTRFSALETARIFSAIAGGKIRPPVFTAGGPAPGAVSLEKLGVDQRELGLIREGLVGSAERFVKAVRNKGLNGVIAGMPGTAQAEVVEGRQFHTLNFACFAPAKAPEYVVSVRFSPVRLEEDMWSGGSTAGPVAVDLVKRLLNHEF